MNENSSAGWQIYKKSSTRTRTKKYISITKSKTFGLPRPFIDGHGISENDKAVILFNTNSKEIALRFSKRNPDFGYSIRFGKDSAHGAMIVAKKFFEDNRINVEKYFGHYDDYREVPMSDLGFSNHEGIAFVFKLRERNHNDDNRAFVPGTGSR